MNGIILGAAQLTLRSVIGSEALPSMATNRCDDRSWCGVCEHPVHHRFDVAKPESALRVFAAAPTAYARAEERFPVQFERFRR